MANPTYSSKVITLRKTKLGESDLIITALKDDGSLLKAVAKGARKPTNPFATRLDLFSVSECLLAQCKNLDVFSEAKSIDAHLKLRSEIDLSASASPILEALAQTAHEDLQIPRLFDMTCAALSAIETFPSDFSPSITAAFLLKLLAMLGFRPSFTECVCCGEYISLQDNVGKIHFSFQDGGSVCDKCVHDSESVRIEAQVIAWCQLLMMSTFEEVGNLQVDLGVSFAVLQLCHAWLRENLSINLKSLNYLFTSGLF